MARGKLVYSSGPSGGSVPSPEGGSAPHRDAPPAEQPIRVRRETSGRGGKQVTVARGFRLTRESAKQLLKQLKQQFGTGGSLAIESDTTATLELQGDRVDLLVAELVRRGYPAKRAGG